MKKKILIIVLLLGLLIIPSHQVFAADGSWPKEFTHGDYKFSIEDIVLNVYKIEESEDETNNMDIYDAYLEETPVRTIELDPSNFTINPTFKDGEYFKANGTYINVGINITKEDLEELLSEEIAATTNKRNYIIDMVVNYKMLDYPEEFKFVYKRNFFREKVNEMMGFVKQETVTNDLTPLDMTEEQSQVFSGAITRFNTETDKGELVFETELNNETGVAASFSFNGLMFMEKEYNYQEDNNKYALVFHNVSNVDDLIAQVKEMEDYLDYNFSEVDLEQLLNAMDWNIEAAETTDHVVVPNTGMKFPIQLYIFSVIVMISGFAIIVRQLYKDNVSQVRGE